MRLFGRICALGIALVLIRFGGEDFIPWWGDFLSIIVGYFIIRAVVQDEGADQ